VLLDGDDGLLMSELTGRKAVRDLVQVFE